jgi:hypothetical protein
MWFCRHSTAAAEVLELSIPGNAARLAPEVQTCPSVDELISLPNTAVSRDANKFSGYLLEI